MWQETNNALYRKFEFDDFDGAMDFINRVADCAREVHHHPKITNVYNVVVIQLTTHEQGDVVTKKDHQMAEMISKIYNQEQQDESESGGELTHAKLFADGGSRGNPGPSALGYAVLDMNDNVVKKEGVYLGITTNNQAEYRALQKGLETALELGVKNLDVYMDSLLVVNQIKGIWKMKNMDLMPINENIRKLIPKFEKITFSHVPRAYNKIADGMVNECLDAQHDLTADGTIG